MAGNYNEPVDPNAQAAAAKAAPTEEASPVIAGSATPAETIDPPAPGELPPGADEGEEKAVPEEKEQEDRSTLTHTL